MPPLTTSRRLAVVGGFLWLALAAMLLLLAMGLALFSPLAPIFGALGAAAVGHAAILFTQAPTRRLLVGSALIGLLSTLVGLSVVIQPPVIVWELSPYAALSAVAAIVSATAALLSSDDR